MGIQTEDTSKGTCKYSIFGRERGVQKKAEQIFVDIQQQQQQQQQHLDGFTIVSLDESFFFYDSCVRRIWIDDNKRPVVRITGSQQRSSVFGAKSMEEGNKKTILWTIR